MLIRLAILFLTLAFLLTPIQTASADTISFSTPINISNTSGHETSPSAAIDSEGTIHVVWEGNNSDIFYSYKSPGGTWSPPVNISNTIGGSYRPSILVDNQENLHVVWQETPSGSPLYTSKSPGSDWTTPIATGFGGGGGTTKVSLTVDNNDTLHLVRDLTFPDAILYSSKPSGGAWSNVVDISAQNGEALSPTIAVDDNDTLHVIWIDYPPGQEGLLYTAKPQGGTWSTPQYIASGGTATLPYQHIVTGANGTLHVIWVQDVHGQPELPYLAYSTKSPGGSWSNPVPIGSYEGGDFSLAIDQSGTLHLVRRLGIPGTIENVNYEIFYATKPLGGIWSNPINISNTPLTSDRAKLLVGNSLLHVFWDDFQIAAVWNHEILWSYANIDTTSPSITPSTTGTLGNNDWYTSDVNVSWDVNDPESEVTSINGCDPSSVTTDIAGVTFTCQATSAGGTASESATIKRDATAPTVAITSPDNFAILPMGTVLNFSASDNLSGLATITGNLSDGTTANNVTSGDSVNQPGVYTLMVEATDNAGNKTSQSRYFVVYDPSAGFATGGGWLVPGGTTSDTGDQLPGLNSTSRAEFGFVVKYKPGATTPDGQLEFQYKQGDFNLHSTGMEWLVVVNNNWAKFQGKATIKGLEGEYPFRVDGRDGDYGEGNQQDRFIIKIFSPGANPDQADPVYKASGDLQGGNIVIHTK